MGVNSELSTQALPSRDAMILSQKEANNTTLVTTTNAQNYANNNAKNSQLSHEGGKNDSTNSVVYFLSVVFALLVSILLLRKFFIADRNKDTNGIKEMKKAQEIKDIIALQPEDKKNAVLRYFDPNHLSKPLLFTFWMMVYLSGVIFLLIGISMLSSHGSAVAAIPSFIGVALIRLGWVRFRKCKGYKPSDQEMDKYIAENLAIAKAKGLEKAGIDDSELVGESLLITGPRCWNTAGADILSIKGKDNMLRFTPINVNVISMTQHQILCYQAVLDLTTGNLLNEAMDEYFYKDVVSVSTKTESKTIQSLKFGNIQMNDVESFVLTTSGGTTIETILKDPKLIKIMGGGDIKTTDVENTIRVIRKMLREKKQQV